ncbi:hypothetical protein GBF38_020698 [Nibea albiflora]|uniref:Uncharacterized protein n=1 Tax=Nibea albiflora TaxID=240163 RepID=A0ACB7FF89_NIBAL|nr:hypothetical protein GBF38_020698 [Nibea albiflora]
MAFGTGCVLSANSGQALQPQSRDLLQVPNLKLLRSDKRLSFAARCSTVFTSKFLSADWCGAGNVQHFSKSYPIMTVTDYIRSDGHSSDTPTVTWLT